MNINDSARALPRWRPKRSTVHRNKWLVWDHTRGEPYLDAKGYIRQYANEGDALLEARRLNERRYVNPMKERA